AGRAPGWPTLLGAGLAIGAALAVKPVAAPEGCLAFALLTFPALARRRLGLPRFLAMALAYAVLCALPTASLGFAYWLRGGLDLFLEGTLFAPLRYSAERLPLGEAARDSGIAALFIAWPILLAGVAVAGFLVRPSPPGRLARAGLAWLAVGALGIAGPGYFFQHYFLIWLPPLAMLAALGLWRLAGLARPGLVVACFAGLVGAVVLNSWLGAFVPRIDRGTALWLPDPVRQVAAAVRREIRPGEPIFVANYHPATYFLAQAGLPGPVIFPAQLTGGFADVAGRDTNAEVARILAARPRVIVVDRGWWGAMRPGAAAQVAAALREYRLAATVTEERGPVEVWRRG
ncbi:MAG TPA: hypothetical protein VE684_14005, partial [Crenalkalicoccus sp.]|nr:hypothetical protein [Crenalkalicoccus sp.]